jgi:hypothetical protein
VKPLAVAVLPLSVQLVRHQKWHQRLAADNTTAVSTFGGVTANGAVVMKISAVPGMVLLFAIHPVPRCFRQRAPLTVRSLMVEDPAAVSGRAELRLRECSYWKGEPSFRIPPPELLGNASWAPVVTDR